MSSGTSACELVVDDRLRRCLVAGAVVAWATGLAVIAAAAWRADPGRAARCLAAGPPGVLWTALSALELRSQLRGMARLCRIRMKAGGGVEAIGRDGRAFPVRLLSGSLVLERFAWLRLEAADGCRWGEWLRRVGDESPEWRAFRVIWRQRRARFGGSGGS